MKNRGVFLKAGFTLDELFERSEFCSQHFSQRIEMRIEKFE